MNAGLLDRYGCGPVRFTGHHDALYERHLMFDFTTDPAMIGAGASRFNNKANGVTPQRWRKLANPNLARVVGPVGFQDPLSSLNVSRLFP